MEDNELRSRVARQLKIGDVPSPLWERVKRDGLIEEAQSNGEKGREDLLDYVQEHMSLYRSIRKWDEVRSKGEQHEGVSISVADSELRRNENSAKRARATEEYISKVASCESSVYEFRQRYLDGGVITPEQARSLLSSRAAALLPSSYFASSSQVRIPVDHKVLDIDVQHIEDEGRIHKFHDDEGEYEPVRVVVDPPGAELRGEIRHVEDLLFPDDDGRLRSISVDLHSLLGKLLAVCHALLERRLYPWQEHQAAWFVLTGEPPTVPALAGGYRTSSNPAITDHAITISVKPWVPAETVRRLYGRLQERVIEGKPRSLSARNLAVFRFVVAQTEVRGADEAESGDGGERATELTLVRPPWRALLRLWNQRHPEGHGWHYDGVRNFSRDFGRAEKAIIHPRYKMRDKN